MCQNTPCTRRNGPGVLILSEFAGSAQSLSGAIRVNPWNTSSMSEALEYGLTLPLMEREYRQTNLYRYVKTHTASFWGKSFLLDLEFAVSKPLLSRRKKLMKLPVMEVLHAYTCSKNRIFVLDYEGTLLEEIAHGHSALAPPKAFVKKIMETLGADKKNTILLVSGHEKNVICSWLDDPQVGVVAESGYFYRMPHEKEWQTREEQIDEVTYRSWKKVVRPIMQYFTERTPGSYIEATKESSLTWHYGETDAVFGLMQARDMQINLEDVLCNLPLEVIQGTNRVEVRLQGITKTIVIEELMKQMPAWPPADFIFCAGNGLADEDMFVYFKEYLTQSRQQPETAAGTASSLGDGRVPLAKKAAVYTCHIGAKKTEVYSFSTSYFLFTTSYLVCILYKLYTTVYRPCIIWKNQMILFVY
jgi:trehalose 6-phosphate synthase/phosphatase